MESLETSFVRRNDSLCIESNIEEPEAIKTCSFADCFILRRPLEPSASFISPGIIIEQAAGQLTGSATDGTVMFRYKAEHFLRHFVMNGRYLFALDGNTAYVYSPGDGAPDTSDLGRRPIGWACLPRTKTFIYWTPLSLHVYDPELSEHKTLRGHHSRVTAAVATSDVVVTGDSIGYIRIWYVSSWQCHHNISTGHGEILKLCIQNKSVYVLSTSHLKEYDLQTGVPRGTVSINATNMILLEDSLLISDGRNIALFRGLKPLMCIKQTHRQLISAEEGGRFFTLSNKGIVESEWPNSNYPEELLEWVREPSIPFKKIWPKKTYMDVLAMSADIWIPKIETVNLPKHWFRHERLRDAIWTVSIAKNIDVSFQWLTPHILTQWYQKNIRSMLLIAEADEYDPSASHILERVFKHVDIVSFKIQKWCWQHHDKIALKHTNIHQLQQDNTKQLWTHISTCPVTAFGAGLLTPKAVKVGIKHGFVAIYVRMLRKYHECLPSGPSHHMKKIFNLLSEHIYKELCAKTLSTPLKESGEWVLLERPNPSHLGAYIQHRNLNGHISKIEFRPEVQIDWIPVTSAMSLTIAADEPIHIWKYYHQNGPNTMLECALTILSNDIWQTNARITKFIWPKTELGAFECEGTSIRVFGEPMRITTSHTQDGTIRFKTSTGLSMSEDENVEISTVVPLWSYFEDQLYYIIPIRLKICSEISKTIGTRSKVSCMYAKELLSAIQFKTVQDEHRHRTHQNVTALSGEHGAFFLGLDSGEIIEYESAANFTPVRHFIKHVAPVVFLAPMDTRLVSLCEDEMNVWCLHTGCLLFGKMSGIEFVSCISIDARMVYIVEKDQDHAEISLWDILEENVVHTSSIETKGKIFTTQTPAIITEYKVISLKQHRSQYELDPDKGEITCCTATTNGICGGTDMGVVFIVNEHDEEIYYWSSTNMGAVTAVHPMGKQPYVITGTARGEIAIWKIDDVAARMDCISIARITTCKIDHIFFDNMFGAVVRGKNIYLHSIVQDRCVLAAKTISKIMRWSEQWKRRMIKETQRLIQPCVETCILNSTGMPDAFELLLQSTDEYADRRKWCNREFVDILLESPAHYSKLVIKRLASFSGPKLDCAICNDENRTDKVIYLKPCQHRFHAGCIAELIRKVPEYHHEMQEEYALHVTLKCPICREPFAESDVIPDRFLNQNCVD